MTEDSVTPRAGPANSSFELASHNTGLAIQRTRLSADRTLMAVIRTSMALLGFGFTIEQILRNLLEGGLIKGSMDAGRQFGIALALLSNLMLVVGILHHAQFMSALRKMRNDATAIGLIRGESPFPYSFVFVAALVLLGISATACASMLFQIGPFE